MDSPMSGGEVWVEKPKVLRTDTNESTMAINEHNNHRHCMTHIQKIAKEKFTKRIMGKTNPKYAGMCQISGLRYLDNSDNSRARIQITFTALMGM